MEFYFFVGFDKPVFDNCFNSQRDGILHNTMKKINGQEERFNSQRDGILHSAY